MIPDFSSFVPNVVWFTLGTFMLWGSSGRVCRLLDLKDVFHVAWIKIIKGLINFHA